MDCDGGRHTGPTRRAYLASGGTLLAGGLLAGCLGDGGEAGTPTDTETTEQSTTTAGATTTAESGSAHSVSMAPVGTVEFEAVPERWVANNGSWADMGVALGQDPPLGVWLTERYHTQYYDPIPGLSVDKSDMVSLSQDGVSKELFYDLDGDVHVIDPNFLMGRFNEWEQADVDEIRDQVAPFFGNSIFSRGYPWHEDYQYYSLLEAFEKLAGVFQERERYEAFVSVHEEFQGHLGDVVPPEENRPSVAVLWPHPVDAPDSFSPYLVGEGTSFKHLRDLGVRDALAETDVEDFHASRGEIDYETLLAVDPEVLLIRGNEAKSASEFRETVLASMEDKPTASELTAVQNGDVYRGGSLYQGPITNLVLTERTAGQLYGVDQELFDRERVANIVAGEF